MDIPITQCEKDKFSILIRTIMEKKGENNLCYNALI